MWNLSVTHDHFYCCEVFLHGTKRTAGTCSNRRHFGSFRPLDQMESSSINCRLCYLQMYHSKYVHLIVSNEYKQELPIFLTNIVMSGKISWVGWVDLGRRGCQTVSSHLETNAQGATLPFSVLQLKMLNS